MKNEVTFTTNSEKETMDFGRFLGERAQDGLFIALTGDLGAGKTHFVQGLAKGIGIEGVVGSPTFTIMNIYEDGRLPLKHFDFYRLHSEDDLWNIGWEEYGEGGVVVVEWADMFPSLIPEESIHIHIVLSGEEERTITVSWSAEAPVEITKEIENYAAGH
ncbi:tRNA (adenosine(37)-N6)-threonylcarbamoyltransferase complex ATPase subunit type 1 TsaE [uncultured Dialister sp.]|uniref:tRNA (adenosine(37)-N6)-threonylcarbamoyltransferase complex ATPase subunit type 1 TsaE n=1 Tax=Dialister succinatiphilus TaxID=487173 RepID=UPI00265ED92B|nr:tRNA (adenosine(37)-N6)-threonylcarbamoyltransferase complex ATPase subunit type 1 TsaE [uncultured Dialister sp.]